MNTEKIYDSDPYLSELEANIISCRKLPSGWAAVLDRTIFFARGGGQACESGTINGVPVLDVYEEGGELLHLLERELPPGPAKCVIDMAQRFDHMQQHLGQHILSAVIEKLFGIKSLIARFEAQSSHVELPSPLTDGQLLQALHETRRVIAADLPVRCYYVSPEKAATLPVRGHISPHESIRLVEIEGFDLNGCGGTHCRSTSEVGSAAFCGVKYVRGVFRLYFKFGGRADADADAMLLYALNIQRTLGSESFDGMAERVHALAESKSALDEQSRGLKEALLTADARFLKACGRQLGDFLFISHMFEGADIKHIRTVCERVAAESECIILTGSRLDGQISLVFARSKGKSGPDMGAALKRLFELTEGRGGGSFVLAQGVMPAGESSEKAYLAICEEIMQNLR